VVDSVQTELHRQAVEFCEMNKDAAMISCAACLALIQVNKGLPRTALQTLVLKLRDPKSKEKQDYNTRVNTVLADVRDEAKTSRLEQANVYDTESTSRLSRPHVAPFASSAHSSNETDTTIARFKAENNVTTSRGPKQRSKDQQPPSYPYGKADTRRPTLDDIPRTPLAQSLDPSPSQPIPEHTQQSRHAVRQKSQRKVDD